MQQKQLHEVPDGCTGLVAVALLLQLCVLQLCWEAPEHAAPPLEGGGFVQVRVSVPLPQEVEHVLHADHPPLTGRAAAVVHVSPLHPATHVLRRQHRQPRAAVAVLAQRAQDGLLICAASVEALLVQRVPDALGQRQLQLGRKYKGAMLPIIQRSARPPARCRRCPRCRWESRGQVTLGREGRKGTERGGCRGVLCMGCAGGSSWISGRLMRGERAW